MYSRCQGNPKRSALNTGAFPGGWAWDCTFTAQHWLQWKGGEKQWEVKQWIDALSTNVSIHMVMPRTFPSTFFPLLILSQLQLFRSIIEKRVPRTPGLSNVSGDERKVSRTKIFSVFFLKKILQFFFWVLQNLSCFLHHFPPTNTLFYFLMERDFVLFLRLVFPCSWKAKQKKNNTPPHNSLWLATNVF